MASRPLANLATSLTVMIQRLFAADRLDETRAAVAHGSLVLSSYDALTLYEFGGAELLELTLHEGHELDAEGLALERVLCDEVSDTRRAASTLDQLSTIEGQVLADNYVRRYGLCLAYPLLAYDDLIGVLVLHYRGRAALLDAEFDAVRRYVACAAVALANARSRRDLRDFAYTDPLTGLASRRRLDGELSRLRDSDLSLLLIDFDGLKAVNDALGYERGDVLIATVAKALAANVREGEIAARMGGDEFVVILPDTGRRHARDRADELTRILDRLVLPDDIAPLFHGASVGAATASPHENPRDALGRAAVEMRSRKRRRKSDREGIGGRVERH
jgi:diguanylate cyclase (GGDEF)-like protein